MFEAMLLMGLRALPVAGQQQWFGIRRVSADTKRPSGESSFSWTPEVQDSLAWRLV